MKTRTPLLLLPLFLACTATSPATPGTPPAAQEPAPAPPPPPTPTVAELLERGRERLDAGRPDEAEALFAEASRLDGGSFRTELWLLRAWMDQGRSNDTLDAIDALGKAGRSGPEMDYLYGMAFARRAEGHLQAGVRDASIQMNFDDALLYLDRAVEADAERFRDAFLPLARAAWYAQDLERARSAADEAVRRFPASDRAALALGRIALSQYRVAADEGRAEDADAHWETARGAFVRADELLREPEGADEERRLAEANVQLGYTLLWKERSDEAAQAFGRALSWKPDSVDPAELRGLFDPRGFLAALEAGAAGFREHFGASDPRDATLLWWLGWARFAQRQRDQAEEAFLAALEKAPGFANAWYYVALVRYDAKDYAGALEALRKGWEIDPTAILRETALDPVNSVAKLEYVIGWCVEEERLEDAALLARICAETFPDEPRHWNNVALFQRDLGDRLRHADEEVDPARLQALFEDAYQAYGRALALTPEDPQLLNDRAVMLHYYLRRDQDVALELYRQAEELARRALDGELSADDRERYRTALRDARNNEAALRKELAEEQSERPAPAGRSDGGDAREGGGEGGPDGG
jgi:tetratricopeptide (TPR) repeat protein